MSNKNRNKNENKSWSQIDSELIAQLMHEQDAALDEMWQLLKRLTTESFGSTDEQLALLDQAKQHADDWRELRSCRSTIARRQRGRRDEGEV